MAADATVAKVFLFLDGKILLIVRSQNDERRPGDYDLPGGGIEPGESILTAVVREVVEETGLVLAEHDLTEIFAPGLVSNEPAIEKHVFTAPVADSTIVLSHEHTAFGWYTPTEVLKLFPHPFYATALRYALKLS